MTRLIDFTLHALLRPSAVTFVWEINKYFNVMFCFSYLHICTVEDEKGEWGYRGHWRGIWLRVYGPVLLGSLCPHLDCVYQSQGSVHRVTVLLQTPFHPHRQRWDSTTIRGRAHGPFRYQKHTVSFTERFFYLVSIYSYTLYFILYNNCVISLQMHVCYPFVYNMANKFGDFLKLLSLKHYIIIMCINQVKKLAL